MRFLRGAVRRSWWLIAAILSAGAAIALFVVFRPVGVFQSVGTVQLSATDKVPAELETLASRDFARRAVVARGLRVFDPETQLPSSTVLVSQVRSPKDSMIFVRLRFDSTDYRAKMADAEGVAAYGDTVVFEGFEFAVARRPGPSQFASIVIVPEEAAVDLLQSAVASTAGETPGTMTIRAASTSPAVAVQLASAMVTAYEALRAAGAGATPVTVLTRPTDATPLRTNTGRYVTLVLVCALLLSVAAVLVRERLDRTVRRPGELEHLLRLPGLAVIPPLPIGFAPRDDADTPAAEAFRALRGHVLHTNGGPPVRCIVVTSPTPSDGTTTTAAHLARSLAEKGRRVLLIDCDMHSPELHELFNAKCEPGLSELLLDRVDMQAAFRQTSTRNLYLLPAGTLPAQPTVLLTSKRFSALLASLSMLFEIVIIDAPPMLMATDASLLAGMTDGVLLVVRAGATEREAAQEAVRQLDVARAHVIGAVLNDANGTAAQYGAN